MTFFPEEASSAAPQVDLLYLALIGLTVFFVVVVALPILYFCIRYRRGSKANRANPSSGSLKMELGWTIAPTIIGMGLFVWGATVYYKMETPPENPLEVHVVAKQWMWKLQHEEGRREINELHIPIGRPVRLLMASQDVIHSFYIPAFRTKQDVVPGRYTTEWFTPTKTGTYHLFCAEYCGTNHSAMVGKVTVMEPEDYARWIAAGSEDAMTPSGARLFRDLGCSGCHGQSQTIRAPMLEGLYGRVVALDGGGTVVADEQYLHDSIVLPASQITAGYSDVMPTFKGQVSEAEIMQLVAYIKSLVDASPGTATNRP